MSGGNLAVDHLVEVKRETQIRGVIEATAGMYGDLQGIAGRSFQEIEGLDHKLSLETRKLKS